jgi:N-alpha-acetyltransferase 15/16, NatA auxiliary subunit
LVASISEEIRAKSVNALRDLSEEIPRATAPRRLALQYSTGPRLLYNISLFHFKRFTGDQFNELIQAYLVSGLTKGIPSLFVDIKALYEDAGKKSIIETLMETWRESLASDGTSPFQQNPSSSSAEPEPPTTYLWTLYFLAQHYSFLGQHARSLSLLELAITHTPSLPELHTCRARVLKRAGDPYGSAKSLNDARLLDLQDRFLNTKCAKYRLRAGLPEEAQEVLALFTKVPILLTNLISSSLNILQKEASSAAADLEDMQSLLFLIEDGDAYNKIGKIGMALKRYMAVQKVRYCFVLLWPASFDHCRFSTTLKMTNMISTDTPCVNSLSIYT